MKTQKIKKTAAFLIALALCATLLCSCGGGKTEPASAAQETVAATEAQNTEALTAPAEETAEPETLPAEETVAETPAEETAAELETTAEETAAELETKAEETPAELETTAEKTAASEETGPAQEETPEVTTPADKGFEKLSREEQYLANLFLSNFAKQKDLEHFNVYNSGVASLLSFARQYLKLNDFKKITNEDGFEVIDLEDINEVTDRFLGVKAEESRVSALPAPSDDPAAKDPFYEDGKVYFHAADGAAYNTFAVVDEVEDLSNGTYKMYFKVYEIDLKTYFEMQPDDFDLYYDMTVEDADAAEDLTYVRDGDAIVNDFEYEGIDTYRLSDYNLR